MPIYTKKGDRGETGLLGKDRFSKADLIFSVIGTIDEANSHLGLAASLINPKLDHKNILKNKIEQVQKTLFDLGAMFAGAKISIPKSVVKKYEKEIDLWQKIMPQRKNFILPGGCRASSELFIARTVVRRLEREVVAFSKKQNIKLGILIFINRLSDYLFVLARYINFQEKLEETVWEK
jgi:cob(I)alamin adenosyltransferase